MPDLLSVLHFAGTDFVLSADELDPDLLADLLDCGSPGPADEAVAHVLRRWTVTGDPADCAAFLRGYGAWDAEELADHGENLSRLAWLTGCDLRESGEAYFSGY